MSTTLAKGGNVSLSRQAPGLTAVTVGLGWQAGNGYEPDGSALLCDADGRVLSDEHFVFFNNPSSPDGSVRHEGQGRPAGEDDQRIRIDLTRLPDAVEKVVFPLSLYDAAGRGHTFGQVRRVHIRVLDQDGGTELARYEVAGGALGHETALVLGELYRHGAEWKFRAVGQGYASGLAGVASDYGVTVPGEAAAPEPAPPKSSATPEPSPYKAPAAPEPAPHKPSAVREPMPHQAPAPPAAPLPPAPPPAPAPAPPAPVSAVSAHPTGSSAMTCFFDPNHGPGVTTVSWSPQWGVPRPVQTCGGCAQRVQTTVPPFYTPPQQGYPQPVAPGYPQQGYPQGYPQQGYPQQGYGQPYDDRAHEYRHHDHDEHGGGRRFGTGALIGAGAAGLIGGALLNEAFDDDEPDVVNNFYED
ncbi:TerD family protein [Streptomyces sp. SID8366]|uniref:TerD family protein n=2 Tax=Streptomyces TaxID=1883 RepID=UPI000DB93B02|nr:MULTISPECIES: TerD family protein [unclassified Streptomyces]MYU07024.1 TerD family protein [Streptomyces sp. SID8366]RAJ61260.1 tellurium resistance protein TerD [Streptomyces sp. PsTaAH-130]